MNYLSIKEDKLAPTVVKLNELLSNYHIYYQNLRNFHWNILGENFFELHEQFEKLYTDARQKIDEMAERILTLRYHPVSKLSEYLKISEIKEASSHKSDREMVITILENHKILLTKMNEVINEADKIKDEGTIDLLGAYIRELEKSSWMLNAFTKKTESKLNESLVKNS